MATINITEKEYHILFGAVLDLHDRGDIEDAKILDNLAKKANTALTKSKFSNIPWYGDKCKEFVAQSPLETYNKLSAKQD
jgi:hypothetical protein